MFGRSHGVLKALCVATLVLSVFAPRGIEASAAPKASELKVTGVLKGIVVEDEDAQGAKKAKKGGKINGKDKEKELRVVVEVNGELLSGVTHPSCVFKTAEEGEVINWEPFLEKYSECRVTLELYADSGKIYLVFPSDLPMN